MLAAQKITRGLGRMTAQQRNMSFARIVSFRVESHEHADSVDKYVKERYIPELTKMDGLVSIERILCSAEMVSSLIYFSNLFFRLLCGIPPGYGRSCLQNNTYKFLYFHLRLLQNYKLYSVWKDVESLTASAERKDELIDLLSDSADINPIDINYQNFMLKRMY